MRKYQTGDVVQLITGGPIMAILHYEAPLTMPGERPTENNTYVTCEWWDENSQQFLSRKFHQDTLKKVKTT